MYPEVDINIIPSSPLKIKTVKDENWFGDVDNYNYQLLEESETKKISSNLVENKDTSMQDKKLTVAVGNKTLTPEVDINVIPCSPMKKQIVSDENWYGDVENENYHLEKNLEESQAKINEEEPEMKGHLYEEKITTILAGESYKIINSIINDKENETVNKNTNRNMYEEGANENFENPENKKNEYDTNSLDGKVQIPTEKYETNSVQLHNTAEKNKNSTIEIKTTFSNENVELKTTYPKADSVQLETTISDLELPQEGGPLLKQAQKADQKQSEQVEHDSTKNSLQTKDAVDGGLFEQDEDWVSSMKTTMINKDHETTNADYDINSEKPMVNFIEKSGNENVEFKTTYKNNEVDFKTTYSKAPSTQIDSTLQSVENKEKNTFNDTNESILYANQTNELNDSNFNIIPDDINFSTNEDIQKSLKTTLVLEEILENKVDKNNDLVENESVGNVEVVLSSLSTDTDLKKALETSLVLDEEPSACNDFTDDVENTLESETFVDGRTFSQDSDWINSVKTTMVINETGTQNVSNENETESSTINDDKIKQALTNDVSNKYKTTFSNDNVELKATYPKADSVRLETTISDLELPQEGGPLLKQAQKADQKQSEQVEHDSTKNSLQTKDAVDGGLFEQDEDWVSSMKTTMIIKDHETTNADYDINSEKPMVNFIEKSGNENVEFKTIYNNNEVDFKTNYSKAPSTQIDSTLQSVENKEKNTFNDTNESILYANQTNELNDSNFNIIPDDINFSTNEDIQKSLKTTLVLEEILENKVDKNNDLVENESVGNVEVVLSSLSTDTDLKKALETSLVLDEEPSACNDFTDDVENTLESETFVDGRTFSQDSDWINSVKTTMVINETGTQNVSNENETESSTINDDKIKQALTNDVSNKYKTTFSNDNVELKATYPKADSVRLETTISDLELPQEGGPLLKQAQKADQKQSEQVEHDSTKNSLQTKDAVDGGLFEQDEDWVSSMKTTMIIKDHETTNADYDINSEKPMVNFIEKSGNENVEFKTIYNNNEVDFKTNYSKAPSTQIDSTLQSVENKEKNTFNDTNESILYANQTNELNDSNFNIIPDDINFSTNEDIQKSLKTTLVLEEILENKVDKNNDLVENESVGNVEVVLSSLSTDTDLKKALETSLVLDEEPSACNDFTDDVENTLESETFVDGKTFSQDSDWINSVKTTMVINETGTQNVSNENETESSTINDDKIKQALTNDVSNKYKTTFSNDNVELKATYPKADSVRLETTISDLELPQEGGPLLKQAQKADQKQSEQVEHDSTKNSLQTKDAVDGGLFGQDEDWVSSMKTTMIIKDHETTNADYDINSEKPMVNFIEKSGNENVEFKTIYNNNEVDFKTNYSKAPSTQIDSTLQSVENKEKNTFNDTNESILYANQTNELNDSNFNIIPDDINFSTNEDIQKSLKTTLVLEEILENKVDKNNDLVENESVGNVEVVLSSLSTDTDLKKVLETSLVLDEEPSACNDFTDDVENTLESETFVDGRTFSQDSDWINSVKTTMVINETGTQNVSNENETESSTINDDKIKQALTNDVSNKYKTTFSNDNVELKTTYPKADSVQLETTISDLELPQEGGPLLKQAQKADQKQSEQVEHDSTKNSLQTKDAVDGGLFGQDEDWVSSMKTTMIIKDHETTNADYDINSEKPMVNFIEKSGNENVEFKTIYNNNEVDFKTNYSKAPSTQIDSTLQSVENKEKNTFNDTNESILYANQTNELNDSNFNIIPDDINFSTNEDIQKSLKTTLVLEEILENKVDKNNDLVENESVGNVEVVLSSLSTDTNLKKALETSLVLDEEPSACNDFTDDVENTLESETFVDGRTFSQDSDWINSVKTTMVINETGTQNVSNENETESSTINDDKIKQALTNDVSNKYKTTFSNDNVELKATYPKADSVQLETTISDLELPQEGGPLLKQAQKADQKQSEQVEHDSTKNSLQTKDAVDGGLFGQDEDWVSSMKTTMIIKDHETTNADYDINSEKPMVNFIEKSGNENVEFKTIYNNNEVDFKTNYSKAPSTQIDSTLQSVENKEKNTFNDTNESILYANQTNELNDSNFNIIPDDINFSTNEDIQKSLKTTLVLEEILENKVDKNNDLVENESVGNVEVVLSSLSTDTDLKKALETSLVLDEEPSACNDFTDDVENTLESETFVDGRTFSQDSDWINSVKTTMVINETGTQNVSNENETESSTINDDKIKQALTNDVSNKYKTTFSNDNVELKATYPKADSVQLETTISDLELPQEGGPLLKQAQKADQKQSEQVEHDSTKNSLRVQTLKSASVPVGIDFSEKPSFEDKNKLSNVDSELKEFADENIERNTLEKLPMTIPKSDTNFHTTPYNISTDTQQTDKTSLTIEDYRNKILRNTTDSLTVFDDAISNNNSKIQSLETLGNKTSDFFGKYINTTLFDDPSLDSSISQITFNESLLTTINDNSLVNEKLEKDDLTESKLNNIVIRPKSDLLDASILPEISKDNLLTNNVYNQTDKSHAIEILDSRKGGFADLSSNLSTSTPRKVCG